MEKSTVLVFKFDGILINTVEIFLRRVWQIISNLNMLGEDFVESRIDHLVIMNWEKNPGFLAKIICSELRQQEKAAQFERDLLNIDYNMVADFRLNQDRFEMVKKLSNADFPVAVYSSRSFENLRYLARLVGLDLKQFNYVLTRDIVPSLSQWLNREKIGTNLVYFGNTTEDALLAPRESVIILPEFNKDEEVIEIEKDYLVSYLEINFLKARAFAPIRIS